MYKSIYCTVNETFFMYLRRVPAFVVFLIVGVVFIGVAGYVGYTTKMYLQHAKTTTGKVVDLLQQPDRTFKPVIHYALPGTDTLEYISSVSSKPAEFEIGETVELLYSVSDTSDIKVNTFVELWLLPAIFGGMGLLFAGMPVVGFLWSKRTKDSGLSLHEKFEQVTGRKFGSKQTASISTFQPNSKHGDKWIWAFPGLGVFLLSIAGYTAYHHQQFVNSAPRYNAKVIAIEFSGRKRMAYPLFEFVANNNDTVRVFSSIGSSPPDFQVGDVTEVLFDADDATAMPRGFFNEWFVVTILATVGFFFTVIGLLFLFAFK